MSNKVAVVTGGARGLGLHHAVALAQDGYDLVINDIGVSLSGDSGSATPAEEAVDRVCEFGIKAVVDTHDVASWDGSRALISTTLESFGRIDVLVNNAGSLVARIPVTDLDDSFIDKVFDLNCRQLIHCCRLAAKLMKEQGSGNIINVTSIAARNGASPGGAVYAGAKGFVSAFSKTLAKELVGHGVRVNCVSPGTIYTAFHDRFSDEAKREATRKTIPMQRLGVADDCAGTFLYLASDKASGYVTGQVIEVNGGQLMP